MSIRILQSGSDFKLTIKTFSMDESFFVTKYPINIAKLIITTSSTLLRIELLVSEIIFAVTRCSVRQKIVISIGIVRMTAEIAGKLKNMADPTIKITINESCGKIGFKHSNDFIKALKLILGLVTNIDVIE